MTNGKAQISFATSLLLAIVLWDSLTIIDIQLKPRDTFYHKKTRDSLQSHAFPVIYFSY